MPTIKDHENNRHFAFPSVELGHVANLDLTRQFEVYLVL